MERNGKPGIPIGTFERRILCGKRVHMGKRKVGVHQCKGSSKQRNVHHRIGREGMCGPFCRLGEIRTEMNGKDPM